MARNWTGPTPTEEDKLLLSGPTPPLGVPTAEFRSNNSVPVPGSLLTRPLLSPPQPPPGYEETTGLGPLNHASYAGAQERPAPEPLLDDIFTARICDTTTFYFKQKPPVDLDKDTDFEIVDDQGQVLFRCDACRIPSKILQRVSTLTGTVQDETVLKFNTKYTVIGQGRHEGPGQIFMLQIADGKLMCVKEGNFPNPSIGSLQKLRRSNSNEMTYYGITAEENGDFFTLQMLRGETRRAPHSHVQNGDQFIIQHNGAAIGVMKRGLPNCLVGHAQSFGLRVTVPATEIKPQTKALILAAAVHVFDYHFLETIHGSGGISRGLRVMGRWKVCGSILGILIGLGFVAAIVYLRLYRHF